MSGSIPIVKWMSSLSVASIYHNNAQFLIKFWLILLNILSSARISKLY
jgi:hypothetical protein